MSNVTNRQIRLIARPDGPIHENLFQTTEEPLAELGDNQILLQNLYFALDPAFNVDGEILEGALLNLNFRARVLMCGTIFNYNNDLNDRAGPANMWQLLVKNARIEGFTVAFFAERWREGTAELAQLVKRGELHYKEQIVDGLDNAIDAFGGLLYRAAIFCRRRHGCRVRGR